MPAPAASWSCCRAHGTKEAGVLRAAILTALAKQESHAAIPDGLTLKVTVRKVAPTHPTMQQQLVNPSLSRARTRYLGDADLMGELLDSRHQVLATVKYSDFEGVLAAGWRSAGLSH